MLPLKGYFCWKGDYLRAKYLEVQERLTPEQEAEIAAIPEDEWVCYAYGNNSMIYANYEYQRGRNRQGSGATGRKKGRKVTHG